MVWATSKEENNGKGTPERTSHVVGPHLGTDLIQET